MNTISQILPNCYYYDCEVTPRLRTVCLNILRKFGLKPENILSIMLAIPKESESIANEMEDGNFGDAVDILGETSSGKGFLIEALIYELNYEAELSWESEMLEKELALNE